MTRKVYESKSSRTSGPYSHAVDSADYVHLSGQTAMSASGSNELKGDINAQTEQCFVHLFEVLEDAGLAEGNVVKVNVYITSMEYLDSVNEVYETKFTYPYPARTCVTVKELPDNADVEIEMVAKKA